MNEADYFIVESHIKPAILEDPRITDNDAYLGEVILTIDDGRIVGVQTLDGKYHTGSIG